MACAPPDMACAERYRAVPQVSSTGKRAGRGRLRCARWPRRSRRTGPNPGEGARVRWSPRGLAGAQTKASASRTTERYPGGGEGSGSAGRCGSARPPTVHPSVAGRHPRRAAGPVPRPSHLRTGLAYSIRAAAAHPSSCTSPPPAALPEAARWHHSTAVPSSSTIRVGIASRVTPSIVVAGVTPKAPNRDASTP